MGRSSSGAFGRYQKVGVLGRGSMGVVFRAHDALLGRDVALKLVDADRVLFGSHGEAGARLLREAQAMARITHPNVVAVFDAGWCRGVPFIAMQLVEGRGLDAWLPGGRTWREVAAVFRQAAEGLAAAHRAGLVHRDFKPSNVLRGDDGLVRVVDFGLAVPCPADARSNELTPEDRVLSGASNPFVGTPAYMAPEQHLGHRIDARSDIYAFGCSLYEALTGQPPFAGRNAHGLLHDKHEHAHPPLPRTIPRWLRALVHRCLAPTPTARPSSMTEISHTLATAGSPSLWPAWPRPSPHP